MEKTKKSPSFRRFVSSFTKNPTSRVGAINPFRSVGARLFLFFFVSIVLCVMVVGLLSYNTSKSIMEKKYAAAAYQTVSQATEKLDLVFGQFEALTLQMFLDQEIKDAINSLQDDKTSSNGKLQANQNLDRKVSSYMFANDALQGIHLIPLEKGKPSFTTSGAVPTDVISQPWFDQIVKLDGKNGWLDTKKHGYFDNSSTPTIAVARVLKDPISGKKSYMLMIEIKLENLRADLESVRLSPNSTLDMIGQGNKVLLAKTDEELETVSPVPLVASKESEPGRAIKNGELIVFSPSKVTGWNLVETARLSELTKETNTIFTLTLVMILFAALFSVGMGYLVARLIGRPLVQLKTLMEKGEQGNLQVRSAFGKRADEIGLLGRSFNLMMDKITYFIMQANVTAGSVLQTAAELTESSRQTAQSAKEIAVATEEIATGASSLASEAERGNDLSAGISVQMNNVIQANKDMSLMSTEVRTASAKGTESMTGLLQKTNDTEKMTRSMVEKVDKLKESTSSIRKILEVLHNMTKQTNILSLNATIEAARAGAAGKGFMVVAGEIRKLADQSKQSIDVVGQITDQIQTEIDETVKVLQTAYPLFQSQIASVKEASVIFNQVEAQMVGFVTQLDGVTASVSELDQAQRVLSEAMSNVSSFAEESSATSEEVASLSNEQLNVSEGLVKLSEKLDEVSTSLRQSLSKFTIE